MSAGDGAAGGGISVVIVTFNSRDAIEHALPALDAELEPGDELIVVDNASEDGSAGVARDLIPGATVIEQSRNLGFAAACDAGARAASRELLVLLNPDAVPAPGFAAAIRRPLREGRDWAAWMGLVTTGAGARVNSSGGIVHFTGIAWAGGAGLPAAEVSRGEVAFLSGACLAVPRARWERLGGFPEPFFLYHEDVDLSLRLRLDGGRIGIEPEAAVEHSYEFEKGAAKWLYLERNRWATLIRTYPAALLALLAPALLATEIALLAIALAGGWGPQKVRAWIEVARWMPRLRRERREIQARRRIDASEFATALSADLSSPYLGRAATSAPAAVGASHLLVAGPGAARGLVRIARLVVVLGLITVSRAAQRAQPLVEPRDLLGEDLRLLGEPRGDNRELEQEQERDPERGEEEEVRRNLDPEVVGGEREQLVPNRQHEQRDRDNHPQQRVALDQPPPPHQLEHDPKHHRRDDDRRDLDPRVEPALRRDEHRYAPLTAVCSSVIGAAGATPSPSGRSGGFSSGTGRRRNRPTKIASRTLAM